MRFKKLLIKKKPKPRNSFLPTCTAWTHPQCLRTLFPIYVDQASSHSILEDVRRLAASCETFALIPMGRLANRHAGTLTHGMHRRSMYVCLYGLTSKMSDQNTKYECKTEGGVSVQEVDQAVVT